MAGPRESRHLDRSERLTGAIETMRFQGWKMGCSRVQVWAADRQNSATAEQTRRRAGKSRHLQGRPRSSASATAAWGQSFPSRLRVEERGIARHQQATASRSPFVGREGDVRGWRQNEKGRSRGPSNVRQVKMRRKGAGALRAAREAAQRNARTAFRLRAQHRQTRICTIVGLRNLPSPSLVDRCRFLRIKNRQAISVRSRDSGRPGDFRGSCSIARCR